MNREKTFDSIPNDLFPDIFSKLSAKLIARCRCVSKLWASILSRQDSTELFLTKSSARPRLLFGVKRANGECLFFSSTQPRNPYEKSSRVVTADFHTKLSEVISREICSYASGLIYLSDMRISMKDEDVVRVICNPIMGKYTVLPKLRRYVKSYSYLGFDPIDKQFKVLLMAYPSGPDDHKILTLGTRKMRWRKIHCPLTHDPFCGGICINGVFYYLAIKSDETLVNNRSYVIVCFDVRFEKFKFIDVDCFYHLINYKGKLGGINWNYASADGSRTFELSMWVLDDAEKHEWSIYDYTFPEHEVVFYSIVLAVGMNGTGEIVLSEKFTSKRFYVFYFNPERNTLQRVEIQGLENHCRVYTIADHVEDLNVNDPKQLKSGPYIITKKPKAQQRRSCLNKIYNRVEAVGVHASPSIFHRVVLDKVLGSSTSLIRRRTRLEDEDTKRVICNPTTGQYVILPELRKHFMSYSYLGFDPIDKEFKVLLMNTSGYIAYNDTDHYILTLGTGKMRWRKIQCPFNHEPLWERICINGVLYYKAQKFDGRSYGIVCFDVRSEKFKFIEAKFCNLFTQLINYKGKLGVVNLKNADDGTRFRHTLEFRMWVLDYVEKMEWSEYVYTLFDSNEAADDLVVVGMTATGDIILSKIDTSEPTYVFYFNPERNTLQSVEIQGFGANRDCRVYPFVDYVDDLSFNHAKQLKSSPVKQGLNVITKTRKPKQRRHRSRDVCNSTPSVKDKQQNKYKL
ncbi:F-box associated domain type 3, partial [Arabidopsis suecica]